MQLLFSILGHGGDGFIKFQEAEEITNFELADAFEQMWQKGRSVESGVCLCRILYQLNILTFLVGTEHQQQKFSLEYCQI